jgi:hypothetical protein
MKKIMIIVAIITSSLFGFSQDEEPDGYVLIQNYWLQTQGGPSSYDFNVFLTGKIFGSEKFSFTGFFLAEKPWFEQLLGVTYSPNSWLSVGVSGGGENNPALYRLGASLWMGKGKTSWLTLFEKGDGRKNYWYKSALTFETAKHFTVGGLVQRFVGLGPYFEYHISGKASTNLRLAPWIAPVYDLESGDGRIMAGFDFKF